MKNIIKISLVFLTICFITSCEKVLIGVDAENSPENNFELFWNDFNEGYGLFQARNRNWDSIYHLYRPEVNENTTFEELFETFSEMVEYLDDTHVAIFERERQMVFASGYTENKKAHDVMDRELVENNYLKGVDVRDLDNLFVQGLIKDKSLGYIYWQGVEDYHDDYFDRALESFTDQDAIIIDIRSNRGGDGTAARDIAGRFSDGEHFIHTVRDKIGPGPDDFSEAEEIYTSVHGDEQWTKPVVILTNRASISAAEDFLISMRAFAHVTLVGDISAGDFSNTSMHRFLPNGLEYKYSTQWYQLPDGSTIDGVGIVPNVEILNTIENVEIGVDAVMDRAFEFLKDEYGIE